MKLISEEIESVEIIAEEKNGKKNLYIHCLLYTSDAADD